MKICFFKYILQTKEIGAYRPVNPTPKRGFWGSNLYFFYTTVKSREMWLMPRCLCGWLVNTVEQHTVLRAEVGVG